MNIDIPDLIAKHERALVERGPKMPSQLTVVETLELLRMVPQPAPEEEEREEMARQIAKMIYAHDEMAVQNIAQWKLMLNIASLVLSWRAEWERAARATALEEAAQVIENTDRAKKEKYDWPNGDSWCLMLASRIRALQPFTTAQSQPQDGHDIATAPRWRHVGRGTTYAELGRAELQMSQDLLVEGSTLVIYRDADGKLWARQEDEFEDGSFERVTPPAPEPST